MGEPNLIVGVLESVIEGQGVIGIDAFTVPIIVLKKFVVVKIRSEFGRIGVVPRYFILEILYVFACALPAVSIEQGVHVAGVLRETTLELF